MRYRIALCGFSEFEYRAIHFSFQHPTGFHDSEYDVVDSLLDADFAVVDADSTPAVRGVMQSGRMAQSVFVGTAAPYGAAWHLRRPIDPTRILRTLDALTAYKNQGAATTQPGALHDLPTLHDIVALPQAAIEAAAVLGLMIPLVVSDITHDSGRFSLGMGIVGLAVGIGATLSTTIAGYVADHMGDQAAYLTLAAFAVASCVMVWFVVPETRERRVRPKAEVADRAEAGASAALARP